MNSVSQSHIRAYAWYSRSTYIDAEYALRNVAGAARVNYYDFPQATQAVLDEIERLRRSATDPLNLTPRINRLFHCFNANP